MTDRRILFALAFAACAEPTYEPIDLRPAETAVTLDVLNRMDGCLTTIKLVKRGDFWRDYENRSGCAFDRHPSRRFWIDRQGRCVRIDESSCGDGWQAEEITGDCAALAPECCGESDWPRCPPDDSQP